MPTWGNPRPHFLTEKSSYSEGPSATKKTSTPWKENQRGGKTSLSYSYWWSPVVQSSSPWLMLPYVYTLINTHPMVVYHTCTYTAENYVIWYCLDLFIITRNLEYQVKSRFRWLVQRQIAYITMINKCHSTTIRYLEVNLVHMYLFNF